MDLIWEFIKFIIYSSLIVLISKNILVKTLRNLAENLKLKPKTVGNIAGISTSIPELLTISVSSFNGLQSASIYNVISSNIINLVQYLMAVVLNNNKKELKNKAIKIDLILVAITIIIPLLFIAINSNLQITMVPILFFLYLGFYKINNNVHNLYLKNEDKEIEKILQKEDKWEIGNKRKVLKNIIILLISGILLFVIGNLLGNNLERLCDRFAVPQFLVGIMLGFVTSIPELITFFESQKHYKKAKNNMLGVVEATNNLLMSNVLNLFVIQSIGIIIFTILYG